MSILFVSLLFALARSLGETAAHFMFCALLPTFCGGLIISVRPFRHPRLASTIGVAVCGVTLTLLSAVYSEENREWLLTAKAFSALSVAALLGAISGKELLRRKAQRRKAT